jgi:outer membrane protein TolC
LAGLAALVLLAGTALGQPAQSDKEPKKPAEEKKPSALEEMLSQAMRDNPDVRVAEAKMREAEAELNRARLLAIQKVVAHQHTIETATAAVKTTEAQYQAAEASVRSAEVQYQRILELSKKGAIGLDEVDAARAKLEQAKANLEAAKAALQAAKADVAKAQAELPYLLGKGNKQDSDDVMRRRIFLDVLGRLPQPDEFDRPLVAYALDRIAKEQPQGSVADKLRKSLDTTGGLGFADDATLGTVLDQLQRAAGVPIVSTLPRNTKVREMRVKDIPLGAAFQCVEDVGHVEFGVRDYGILVSAKLPTGVTRLYDFWKSPIEKPKPGREKPKSSQHNPPPGNVEGKVSAVDAKSGLIELSVGRNSGLQVGHTLEVYRMNDGKGGKYLGTIRIEETQEDRSVGKVINKLNAPVEVGDRVSSKFFVN